MRGLAAYLGAGGVAILCLAGAAQAMGLFGDSRPTDLSFSDASHPSSPVMVDGLQINGAKMGSFPTLASTRWMNPRGGKTTLTKMPWTGDADTFVDVRAEWTEIATGRAFSAELSVPWAQLSVEDLVAPTASIIIVYGRNGEFWLFTDNGPDEKTGQYNGREVAQTCGQRTPHRDQNYGLRVNEIPGLGRLFERRAQWMSMAKLETSCTGRGV